MVTKLKKFTIERPRWIESYSWATTAASVKPATATRRNAVQRRHQRNFSLSVTEGQSEIKGLHDKLLTFFPL
jgi:hypothetical protein